MEGKPKSCPQCSEVLEVLLFLGFIPDGYVCASCHIVYNDDLQPIATLL